MKPVTEPSPRLNEPQRKRLWENLLLAEARSYYFGDLATKYNREQRVITWASLILSSGATVTAVAVANGHAWLPAVLALAASTITFYSLVAQNHKRAADATDLHTRDGRSSPAPTSDCGRTCTTRTRSPASMRSRIAIRNSRSRL
jgi:hypothetical protein